MAYQMPRAQDFHAFDVEYAFFAAVFRDNKLLRYARDVGLQPIHFADGWHGRTYERCCRIVDAGGVANAFTIYTETAQDPLFARRRGGDPDPGASGKAASQALAKLGATIVNSRPQDIEDYAVRIRNLGLMRIFVESAAHILTYALQAGDEPIEKTMTNIITAANIAINNITTTAQVDSYVAEQLVEQMQKPPACFPTGLPTLDDAMGGGIYTGKLYGLAARKKAGKTMLLSTMSAHLAKAGVKHLFISLEMHSTQIEQRKAAQHIGVNPNAYLATPDDPVLQRQTADYAAQLKGACFYVHRPAATLMDILSLIETHWHRDSIKVVFIDYQQRILGRGERQTQAEHQEFVASHIADICARLKIACVMAAQVNQEGNTRGGEGLRLAADWYARLHREGTDQGAWIEVQDCRYVDCRNVGDAGVSGLWLRNGCYFSEEPGE